MQSPFPFQPRGMGSAQTLINPPQSQVVGVGNGAVQQITVPVVEMECTIRIVIDGGGSGAWCYGTNPGLTANNGVFMLGNTVETFTLPAGFATLSFIFPAGTNFRVHFGDGT